MKSRRKRLFFYWNYEIATWILFLIINIPNHDI